VISHLARNEWLAARLVIATVAINRPLGHAEEVLAVAFLNNVVRHARTGVFDNLLPLGMRFVANRPRPVAERFTLNNWSASSRGYSNALYSKF
jgi:hypothetical protein